jgi:TetR/AcrR family acrAB operon transcriptional repressor
VARRTAADAARTRAAIVDAALVVFAERGFAASQLEDIVRRASVTRGAFYHHFSDKGELYLTVLRERWESVMAPILAALEGPATAELRLREFVNAYLKCVDTDATVRALMSISLSADLRLPELSGHGSEKTMALMEWRDAIAKTVAEVRPSRSVPRDTEALLMGLVGYAVWSSLTPGSADQRARNAYAKALLRTVLGGFQV